MRKILVTPRSVTLNGHSSLERLVDAGFQPIFCRAGQLPSEEELINLLPDCVGYLAGVEKVSAQAMKAAAQLRVISRNGTGVDNIDIEEARKRNITICRASGRNARAVAELTIGLMFSLARWIPFSDQAIKNGRWERRLGFEIAGKTLGVIGFGQIGRIVSGLATALGMKVLAYDVLQPQLPQSDQFRFTSFDEMLEQSDIITLHCPPSGNGNPLIGESAIRLMKKGILIVNTARHELMDQAAIAAGIERGQIAGAAWDVFAVEPPPPAPVLISDRVIVTPHIGGYTTQSMDRVMDTAVDQLLQALAK
jgi:D-3-phosphoglycerate dehydrogenase